MNLWQGGLDEGMKNNIQRTYFMEAPYAPTRDHNATNMPACDTTSLCLHLFGVGAVGHNFLQDLIDYDKVDTNLRGWPRYLCRA